MKVIKGTIDRFEEGKAIIIANGGQIIWPKSLLEDELKEGSSVNLAIVASDREKADEALAKNLLNDILKNSK